MSQQALRQAVAREANDPDTVLDYNSDFLAMCTTRSVDGTDYNGCLLNFINAELGTEIDNLPGAMAAFAAEHGATNFSAIGTFELTVIE